MQKHLGILISMAPKCLVFGFILYFAPSSYSQNTSDFIDYNASVRQCYQKIISLRMEEAMVDIKKLKICQPNNLAIVHLENYVDFFTLFITEDPISFKSRVANKSLRLNYLEEHPVNSPYYRFIKAEILLQWALVRLKFDEKLTAGSEVYEAYKLLEKNKKDYPQFIENYKSLSIIHTLAQSMPSWVRKLIGVKGSISLGTSEIEALSNIAVADPNYLFREEVAAIHSYILFYQNNRRNEALKVLENFKLDHKTNPLVAFLKASIYHQSGLNEKCLEILGDRAQGSQYLDFYYLDFMMGKCKLYRLDADAGKYIQRFLDKFKGQHYIKEAYQKMAWFELVQNNDATAYTANMTKCLSNGSALLDEDKQSLNEAKLGHVSHHALLKARLLYDGGYYAKAEKLLNSGNINFNGNKTVEVEFHYRLGRVYQAQMKNELARIQLNSSMAKGRDLPEYFACGAALQLGLMEEEAHNISKAEKYFSACLDMDPDQYKSSLHQKAKSGLERLKKKQ